MIVTLYLQAQETKPTNPEFKPLQAPNNMTFWYNPVDSYVWGFKGKYGWTRFGKWGEDISQITITGTTTKTLTITRNGGGTVTASFTDNGGTQLQSDWTQTSTTSVDYIKNKPTALSSFTNDLNFITDAPSNGNIYGRKNAAWEKVVGSQWTNESFGISYSTNSVALYANNNSYGQIITNSNSAGSGLFIAAGYGTSSTAKFIDYTNAASNLIMDIRGNGTIFMPRIPAKSSSETKIVYFNPTNGNLAYGDPTSGGGGGDVYGPSSSTDNALARFDGTTGKTIQNSSATLSDAGLLTVSNFSSTGYIWATSYITSNSYISATGNVTAGNGSSNPLTMSSSGYMAMKGITAPSAPTSGAGVLYSAGSSGYEHIYFKTANETFDLTQVGTGLTNPMTSIGDMIYGTTGGAAARLAAGTDGYYLKMQSGIPTWVSSSYTLPVAASSTLGGVKVGSNIGLSMLSDGSTLSNLVLDVNNLTSASLDLADSFPFYDSSGTATRKATLNDLKTLVGGGGSGGAPTDATYITQTANSTLTNEQALGNLATGIMKSTNTTGVVSTLTGTANQYLRRNSTNTDFEFGDLPSGFTNYWQAGSGWIAPATLSNEVRIGSNIDLAGDYKLQINTDDPITAGIISSVTNGNGVYGKGLAIGVHGYSDSGVGLSGQAGVGHAFEFRNAPTSTTGLESVGSITREVSNGTAAAGVGQKIDFYIEVSSNLNAYSGYISNTLSSVTHNAVSSQLGFATANSGVVAEKMILSSSGNLTISGQYQLSSLNTAPASSTATGTTGEIRITADYIYVCIATNTWKRIALSTW